MGDSGGGKNDTHTPKRDWIRAAVDRYERPLLSYTARIIGDADRARDVVQDAFLRLWRRDEAEPDDHIAQWLFTVWRNRALDVVRKERRMKTITDTDARSRPRGEPPPAQAAVDAEAAGHVAVALADLPDNQQEVLRLKFHSGLSYKQIAGVTGLSVSNVGYLIHVGVKQLRSRFQQLGLLGD